MSTLSPVYATYQNLYEIGIDEAGRGPLFGRLYVAAAVLPKDASFHHEWMKDSKKFHSKKKIRDVAEYIKTNALAWSVQYIEPDVIDTINIRQAVFKGMHATIREILDKRASTDPSKNPADGVFLLVDGNDFRPYTMYNEVTDEINVVPHITIEGGDNKYCAIAAASILAKVSHDEYIAELCLEYPELVSRYGLDRNVGYGTKQHLDGIVEHGITQWHRKTYGRCRDALVSPVTAASAYQPDLSQVREPEDV